MARLTVEYFSDALGMSTAMTVLMPQRTEGQIGASGVDAPEAGAPVLYLLHGLSDDHTAWTRRSSIERYVEAHGLAVVMPDAHRSFYADGVASGARHWTHLTEELPTVVASFLRVSDRREDTFVAGLSMGGYGALKWALSQPDRFAAAASLSGALDVRRLHASGDRAEVFAPVYGDAGPGPDDDLFDLLVRTPADGLPALHLSCGSEDPLVQATHRFAEAARAHGVDPTVEVEPGEHEWGYWDRQVQRVLAWLPRTH